MTADDALLELLAQVQSRNYRFTAVTPETHARVVARPIPDALTLRDVFGWNRPFLADRIDPAILGPLRRADEIEDLGGALRSRLRVATLNDRYFLHSAFPTSAAESVFFGPDTYRFCDFITAELSQMSPPTWIVDMGCGSGAGGISVTDGIPAARLTLVDVNPAAVRFAQASARFAGVDAEVIIADNIPAGCDLVIANPPYMIDSDHRTYRDGGGLLGGEVALDWTHQALGSLNPGGTLLLYTGAAVVDGASPLLEAVSGLARDEGAKLAVREIDPDVFGEELSKSQYVKVERIAAVGIRISKGK